MKRIITYNINGIRAGIKKGFLEWLKNSNADIICLQETKIQEGQIDNILFEELGYKTCWHYATKKGYSGTAILYKEIPKNIQIGTGIDYIDNEGRVIRADFENFSVISLYLPSGTNDERLDFKFKFMDDFYLYIKDLKKNIPNLIISGDYNICHKEIDIHNPKQNKNTSGFLPEEREWLSKFISLGFEDGFRFLNKEPHNYSWWSYRANARNNNKGWRIDYNMVSENLSNNIKKSMMLKDAMHSDHCPVLLDIEL